MYIDGMLLTLTQIIPDFVTREPGTYRYQVQGTRYHYHDVAPQMLRQMHSSWLIGVRTL